MSKKTVCGIAIGIVLLLCCILYFRPMPLSTIITESNVLIVQVNDFGVQNGEPYIDSKSYDHITEKQKREVLELIQDYSYEKTLKTYFSDGTMEKIGDKAVSIYVYDNGSVARFVYVSDSGQVSIDSKLYKMKNAKQFNQQLEDILNA